MPYFSFFLFSLSNRNKTRDATTYIITCAPQDAPACDMSQGELTAVKATASARLTQTDINGRLKFNLHDIILLLITLFPYRVASVSCDVQGTTYAFCHAAHGTVDVHATLAPKHLNWMSIPVTGVWVNPPSLTTSSSAERTELLIRSHTTHSAGRNEI